MENWDVEKSEHFYEKNGYTVHHNVNIGKIKNSVVGVKDGEIAISLSDGNLREKVALHVPHACKLCCEARNLYKSDLEKDFLVSKEAMCMEIMIYAYPEIIRFILNNNQVLNAIYAVGEGQMKTQMIKDGILKLQTVLPEGEHTYAIINEHSNMRDYDQIFEIIYKAEEQFNLSADLLKKAHV